MLRQVFWDILSLSFGHWWMKLGGCDLCNEWKRSSSESSELTTSSIKCEGAEKDGKVRRKENISTQAATKAESIAPIATIAACKHMNLYESVWICMNLYESVWSMNWIELSHTESEFPTMSQMFPALPTGQWSWRSDTQFCNANSRNSAQICALGLFRLQYLQWFWFSCFFESQPSEPRIFEGFFRLFFFVLHFQRRTLLRTRKNGTSQRAGDPLFGWSGAETWHEIHAGDPQRAFLNGLRLTNSGWRAIQNQALRYRQKTLEDSTEECDPALSLWLSSAVICRQCRRLKYWVCAPFLDKLGLLRKAQTVWLWIASYVKLWLNDDKKAYKIQKRRIDFSGKSRARDQSGSIQINSMISDQCQKCF